MKRLLIMAAAAILVLYLVDTFILMDNKPSEEILKIEKYEEVNNPNELPIGIEPGNRVPNFELTDIEGKKVILEELRGKKLLLNFWASWCPPCKEEMPYMQEMYEKYQKDGYEILAVNSTVTEKNRQDAVDFVKKYGLTFPIPMDERNEVSSRFEILTYPTSLFIDSDGIIRSRIIGGVNKEFLEDELKRLP
ncbi:thiol:disulfide interchange protein [Bacillus canaveralius]|uniref:Thiol:disulfide interchange protein n=2 Tax=Bacillus canaveralius TaxID=1403243 RepID=A0A2N5GJ18_9BACI|nr:MULTISPECIES: TlpA disulfide reductase family protein [Bacillus]PLR81011.1 thiol:disulfide interchange protein [Bacillus canaveralius]PLR83426.1 thiol:disulfide interchange protein [Bacillus sp. V33-4]PLR99013.1 thiol:disulfide interchange protein [Bacillus canaveralius]RSK51786.1 TlpA family protein disulfide reductase [Bacillus canaveralius]